MLILMQYTNPFHAADEPTLRDNTSLRDKSLIPMVSDFCHPGSVTIPNVQSILM